MNDYEMTKLNFGAQYHTFRAVLQMGRHAWHSGYRRQAIHMTAETKSLKLGTGSPEQMVVQLIPG